MLFADFGSCGVGSRRPVSDGFTHWLHPFGSVAGALSGAAPVQPRKVRDWLLQRLRQPLRAPRRLESAADGDGALEACRPRPAM